MKIKTTILISGLMVFLIGAVKVSAVVVTFGDSARGVQSIYLEDCSAREARSQNFKKCSQEVLDSLKLALSLDPGARIFLTYKTTQDGCDTAEMAYGCLVSHGVPSDRVEIFESPAADQESSGDFVEISLEANNGTDYAMIK